MSFVFVILAGGILMLLVGLVLFSRINGPDETPKSAHEWWDSAINVADAESVERLDIKHITRD